MKPFDWLVICVIAVLALFALRSMYKRRGRGCCGDCGMCRQRRDCTTEANNNRSDGTDIKLYSEEMGAGFPIVLLHGNGGSGEYFKNQLMFFSDHYRVIAVDTRGHGRSPRGTAPFTLEQFADDLKAFFDKNGIRKMFLLGFSDGANIALLFALKNPQYVEKLILNGADLSTKGVKPLVQMPIRVGYALVSLFAKFSEEALKNKEMLSLMVNQPNIDPKELKMLDVPTLVVAGKDDMIKESHTRLIAASIPDAKLCILPGNHFIAEKNPNVFNDAVQRFLNQGTSD